MNGLPIHPAIVHVPIGLSFVLPFLSLAVALLIMKARLPKFAWVLVIALQAVLAGSAWYAEETGEDDRKHVLTVVGGSHIDPHEEIAEKFVKVAAATLLLSGVALFPLQGVWIHAARFATVVADAGNLALAYLTGHSGGELVYQRHAAEAYQP